MTTMYRRARGIRRNLIANTRANLAALAALAPTAQAGAAAVAAMGGMPEARKPRVPAAKPGARRGASEAEVLAAVLGFLRGHPAVAGAARMNGGAMEGEDGRYVSFGFKGCSDIIGQLKHGGRFLAVECKRERGGVVSEAQDRFIAMVNGAGGVAGVVRSVEEAAKLLEGCGR